MTYCRAALLCFLLSTLPIVGIAAEPMPATNEITAASPQAAIDAFQTALKTGDRESALQWLTPDVLIYEGGGVERSRQQYASHHLAADMMFLKTAQVDILQHSSGGNEHSAWITTESRIRNVSSKGKKLDLASTETALLRQTPEGWRIFHLHWSSQDYRPTSHSSSAP